MGLCLGNRGVIYSIYLHSRFRRKTRNNVCMTSLYFAISYSIGIWLYIIHSFNVTFLLLLHLTGGNTHCQYTQSLANCSHCSCYIAPLTALGSLGGKKLNNSEDEGSAIAHTLHSTHARTHTHTKTGTSCWTVASDIFCREFTRSQGVRLWEAVHSSKF